MSILQLVSVAVIIINPISAIMLAWLVVHHRNRLRIGPAARGFVAVYCVTLLLQAGSQVEFLTEWRPPRTTSWIYSLAAQHGIIWALFFKTALHPTEGKGGSLQIR